MRVAIWAANSPFLDYGPGNPHLPLLAAQLDLSNITGWLAAGYHPEDVVPYLLTYYKMLGHANIMLDLR
jgi:hypothetical protein